MRFRASFMLGCLCLAIAGCKGEQWHAYVYYKGDVAGDFVKLGPFPTFEDCQQGAIDTLRAMNVADTGYYECGLNCSWNADFNLDVCKETRK